MDPLAPPVASVHTGCLLLAALLLALLCRCASRALAHPPTHDDGELPELYASSRLCPRAALDPNDRFLFSPHAGCGLPRPLFWYYLFPESFGFIVTST